MAVVRYPWLKGQKTAKVDNETIQTIFVQTDVYFYTDSLTKYTLKSYAGIISEYQT